MVSYLKKKGRKTRYEPRTIQIDVALLPVLLLLLLFLLFLLFAPMDVQDWRWVGGLSVFVVFLGPS